MELKIIDGCRFNGEGPVYYTTTLHLDIFGLPDRISFSKKAIKRHLTVYRDMKYPMFSNRRIRVKQIATVMKRLKKKG